MQIKSQKDFVAGLLFSAIGVAFAAGAVTYEVGTGDRMGPGYFPLMLGLILALLGLAVTLTAFDWKGQYRGDGDPIGRIAWKPLICIVAANLVFGVLLVGLPSIGVPSMGLLVAIVALVFIARLGGDQMHWLETAVLAAVLAAGCYLVFIKALNLQMPVWPWFMVE